MNTDTTSAISIHPAVRVGHVHLRVSDLDRATSFYRDALGLAVTADARQVGVPMVLLAAGDYHHHVGLNTFQSAGAAPPGHTGLYHIGFLYPDRRELARAIRRLLDHGVPVEHGSDHGATVSVYLADPDGNGIELYYDRPRPDWHHPNGQPVLKAERFDPRELLAHIDPAPTQTRERTIRAQLIEGGTTPRRRPQLADYGSAFAKALANVTAICTRARRPISTGDLGARG